MTNILSRFAKDESGATAIEYGLIAAIVGVGIIAALGTLQESLSGIFETVGEKLDSAGTSGEEG
ncbi:MAG: Flp family type IVb pilin [Rhizobiales bacterium]|nr:Flp family type IVb pilin [Hyphomicrobiales bacterium]